MFDKMTENLKFFIMLVIYTGTMAWWASDITSNVNQNAKHIEQTLEAVTAHNTKCERLSGLEYKLSYYTKEVDELKDRLRELKYKEVGSHGRTEKR